MKKSKDVSYTSEELKQMESQTDWDAVAKITDEEIEAAIASDPEEAALYEGWMKRAKVVRPKAYFVMCTSNKGLEDRLTLHKVYRVIADGDADRLKLVRITDDSGQDYKHPASRFVSVQIPLEAEQNFEIEVA